MIPWKSVFFHLIAAKSIHNRGWNFQSSCDFQCSFQTFLHSYCWFVSYILSSPSTTLLSFQHHVNSSQYGQNRRTLPEYPFVVLKCIESASLPHRSFHSLSLRYCFLGSEVYKIHFISRSIHTCTVYTGCVICNAFSPWNIFSVRIWMRLPIIIGVLAIQICCCCYCCACEVVLNDCYCIEQQYATTLCYLIEHYTLLKATYLSEHN